MRFIFLKFFYALLISVFLLDPGVAFADEVNDLIDQASVAIDEQDLDKSIEFLNQAASLAEQPTEKAAIHTLYAYVFYLQGNYEAALGNYEEAFEIVSALEDTLEFQKDLLSNLVFIHRELGNTEELTRYEALRDSVEAELRAGQTQVWILNEKTGDLTFEPLGIVFPETIGRFVRQEPHMFNNEGTDVSIGYQITDISDKAFMTVYLSNYPETDFDGYVAFSRRDLLARYLETADILDERRIIFPASEEEEERGAYGFRLKIKNPENHDNWSDEELWIAGYGHWFIKIRVTKKEVFEDEVGPSFDQFLNEVDLLLSENFLSVMVGQRLNLDFCPSGLGAGDPGAHAQNVEKSELALLSILPLTVLAKADPKDIFGNRCLDWVTKVESGQRIAAFINPTALSGEEDLPGAYQFIIFEPDWRIHSSYQLSSAGDLFNISAVENPDGKAAPESYLLTKIGSDGISLFKTYQGLPSMDIALNDTLKAASEDPEPLVQAIIKENGDVDIILGSTALGVGEE